MTAGSASRPIWASLLVLTREIWRLPVAGFVAQPVAASAARSTAAPRSEGGWSLEGICFLQTVLGCGDNRLSRLIVTLDREPPGSGNRALEEAMPTTSVDLAQ